MLDLEDLPQGRVKLTIETTNQFSVFEADKGKLTEDRLIFENVVLVAHGNMKGLTSLYLDAQAPANELHTEESDE